MTVMLSIVTVKMCYGNLLHLLYTFQDTEVRLDTLSSDW